jgi:16S rRNA (adenine1518-N6/adenine1519-N6)-dimethyltransferase
MMRLGEQEGGSSLSLAHIKGLLRRFDLWAKKGLGQHFLIDEGVLGGIISAADLAPHDLVLEVGPGLGVLTEELARRAGQVIAIEVDNRLVSILGQRLARLSNLIIVNADVLKVNPADLAGDRPYKVVANLPYYIASPVLRHFLEASTKPSRMVVMLQKEVAQNIVAPPGEMSLLSVAVQFYGKPSLVSYVPARSFYPAPKVDSAILSIEVYERPQVEVADIAGFFHVVRAGFATPRKQLRNALAQGLYLSPEGAAGLLQQAGVSPKRRAETLSIPEWAKVYQAYEVRYANTTCLC